MEHAEERGDRHSARALAHTILASGERPIAAEIVPDQEPAAKIAAENDPAAKIVAESDPAAKIVAESDEALARLSARELLTRTEPDPFLLVVGVLGLGLLVWLVYNYVL
jgi:hypothetical protein